MPRISIEVTADGESDPAGLLPWPAPIRRRRRRLTPLRRRLGPGDGAGRRDRAGRALGRGDHRDEDEAEDDRDETTGGPRPQPGPTSIPTRGVRGPAVRPDRSARRSRSTYGSGVVIGDEGQILTAFHVVKGAERLEVRAADGQAFEAEIIAADPRSDLAVIVPIGDPGACRPPAQADRPRRRHEAAQGVVPGRAGQPVQRRPRRQAIGKLGHPLQRRPAARASTRRASPVPGDPAPRTTPRCSSSTPS